MVRVEWVGMCGCVGIDPGSLVIRSSSFNYQEYGGVYIWRLLDQVPKIMLSSKVVIIFFIGKGCQVVIYVSEETT